MKTLELKETKQNDDLITFLQNNLVEKFVEGTLIVIEGLNDSVKTIMLDEYEDDEIPFEETTLMMSLNIFDYPLIYDF